MTNFQKILKNTADFRLNINDRSLSYFASRRPIKKPLSKLKKLYFKSDYEPFACANNKENIHFIHKTCT
jgi:hypothetical protein